MLRAPTILGFCLAVSWVLLGGSLAAQPCELQKLTASDAAEGDEHGVAVDLSDDVLIVGARWDDDLGNFAGAAYIYRHDGTEWVEETKLLASDGAEVDYFGTDVAVDGDLAVVGARGNDDNGFTDSGAVYVFRYTAGQWSEETKLTPDDPDDEDSFGVCVALEGDVIVVGSIFDDDAGNESGSAYVFRFDGNAWVQEDKLVASDADEGDRLGATVDLSGDGIILGAPEDEELGDFAGSTYVFRYNGLFWAEEAKVLAPDGAADDEFGSAVGISDDTIVVGSPFDSDAADDCGAAYIFRRFGAGLWQLEAKFVVPDADVDDEFGSAVAIDGDVAVVGSPLDDDDGPVSGSAYVFARNFTLWGQVAKLTASDGAPFSTFGFSVAVEDELAVIGAPDDDEEGDNAGAVYAFSLDCSTDEFVRGDANGDGDVTGLVDGFFILSFQFVPGSPPPPCQGAADVDDDGTLNGLLDAVAILQYQFVPGAPNPPPPFPGCGEDPTTDTLDCLFPTCP